ncbi:glycoside hydrolase, partial [Tricladium varicosporioides]
DNTDIRFVLPTSYTNADITCHKSSQPGQKCINVKVGSILTFTWAPAPWPECHIGPLIDSLAPCPFSGCTNIDKTQLKFVKLAQKVLKPGITSSTNWLKVWITDDFRNKNSTWDVQIPKDLRSGVYVLRHKIIALHGAYDLNDAQNYPQCIDLKVINGGSTEINGGQSPATFYLADNPGIHFNVYNGLIAYPFPSTDLRRSRW